MPIRITRDFSQDEVHGLGALSGENKGLGIHLPHDYTQDFAAMEYGFSPAFKGFGDNGFGPEAPSSCYFEAPTGKTICPGDSSKADAFGPSAPPGSVVVAGKTYVPTSKPSSLTPKIMTAGIPASLSKLVEGDVMGIPKKYVLGAAAVLGAFLLSRKRR